MPEKIQDFLSKVNFVILFCPLFIYLFFWLMLGVAYLAASFFIGEKKQRKLLCLPHSLFSLSYQPKQRAPKALATNSVIGTLVTNS